MIEPPPLSARQSPRQNRLLAALAAADYDHLLPNLELPLPLGWAVYEAGGAQAHLFFPTTSIVSLLYVLEDGTSAEIAGVGNEGLVGIALLMGGESTPSRAVVQSSGYGCRLRASVLKAAFGRGRISVLDRPKLETRVCECYAVVKREYGRLLSAPPAQARVG